MRFPCWRSWSYPEKWTSCIELSRLPRFALIGTSLRYPLFGDVHRSSLTFWLLFSKEKSILWGWTSVKGYIYSVFPVCVKSGIVFYFTECNRVIRYCLLVFYNSVTRCELHSVFLLLILSEGIYIIPDTCWMLECYLRQTLNTVLYSLLILKCFYFNNWLIDALIWNILLITPGRAELTSN